MEEKKLVLEETELDMMVQEVDLEGEEENKGIGYELIISSTKG